MRKNIVQNVIIHITEGTNISSLACRTSEFHVDMIERKLNGLGLTTEQKIAVIDKILDDLKSREVKGFIQ